MFLDPRPSTLDPRPPLRRPSGPKIILKHSYSRYSKSYLERLSYGIQNKWKGFSSFFINDKRNENNAEIIWLKYIQYVHIYVPKYKNLFLHINLKLVPFAPNLPVHSLSLISMLVGILWSSKTFVKTLRH